MSHFLLRLGGLCCVAFVQPAVSTARNGASSSTLANTDLPGEDHRNFDVSSVFRCRNACLDDEQCKAWTFVAAGVQGDSAVCWLKDQGPSHTKSNCCTSGVRLASNEEPGGGGNDAKTASGPHLRLLGMEITLSRRVTASYFPTDQTLVACPLKSAPPCSRLSSRMEDQGMPQKKHKPEEIVTQLRQVDVLVSQGQSVAEAVRSMGVTQFTYYRWRKE